MDLAFFALPMHKKLLVIVSAFPMNFPIHLQFFRFAISFAEDMTILQDRSISRGRGAANNENGGLHLFVLHQGLNSFMDLQVFTQKIAHTFSLDPLVVTL